MTYRELQRQMKKFTDEQLDQDIMIYDSLEKEYFPINIDEIHYSNGEDNLEDNQPFLIL